MTAFLGWGVGLAALQWAVEWSEPARWFAARVTGLVARTVSAVAGLPIHTDGGVVSLHGVTQEVTPTCFGLAAVTVYVAAVLATPAGWRERLRGVGFGLAVILLANVVRLALLSVVFLYAFAAFPFVHVPVWGTVLPAFLLAVWGWWLVHDLRALPRFPLACFGQMALWLVLLFGAWYIVLDRLVVALAWTVNAILVRLAGVPIAGLRLTATDLLRHLEVGLPAGGFRLELAAETLSLVPCLALILASPLPLGRRLLLGVSGAVSLFGFYVAATSALIVIGWWARALVPAFQVTNDFLSLAAGPTLWLLLTRPSPAWFSGSTLDAGPPTRGPRSAPARRRAARHAR